MNELSHTYKTDNPNSSKMLRAMVGIGILCALLIVSTFELTFERIKVNKAEALEKAIFKVLPGIYSKQTYNVDVNDNIILYNESDEAHQLVYSGYDDSDQFKGYAIEAEGMGFADVIKILYGYDPEKDAVVGFYVLESKETPGLGDKIEKESSFLSNFEALDVSLAADGTELENPIIPVKQGKKINAWEVDCITGATISSKAIGNILNESTKYWIPLLKKNQMLFQKEANE